MGKDLRLFYDDNAGSYDQEQDEFGFVRGPEWETSHSTLKSILNKNLSVLEIGAGTGRFTLEIAPQVKKITAVDISQKMLDVMTEKAAEKGITNVTQHCGDFLSLPLTEKFDVIVSFSALEYIKDVKAMFDKVSELLAPGGYLLFTTAHDTFFRWWGRMGNYFRQGVFMEAYSKRRMRKILESRGLTVIELKDMCLKSFFVKGIMLFVYAKR